MFFLKILSAYLIPGIYTCIRINLLFIRRKRSLVFTILFSALIATFPVTEMMSDHAIAGGLAPLLRLGYYTMPFLLYLFILVLLFDLFLLLNLLFRWLPKGFHRSTPRVAGSGQTFR